jgi:hypothetical protein
VPFSTLPYFFFLQVLFAQQSAGLSVDYNSSSQTFAYQGARFDFLCCRALYLKTNRFLFFDSFFSG